MKRELDRSHWSKSAALSFLSVGNTETKAMRAIVYTFEMAYATRAYKR